MTIPVCPHCIKPGRLTSGAEIYPHRPDLAAKPIWVCDCGARVGCHPGTTTPLGTPANAMLRAERGKVHALLDPIWRDSHHDRAYGDEQARNRGRKDIRRVARIRVYAYLAEHMGLTAETCHVGMFDLAQCAKALSILTDISYAAVRAWAKAQAAEQVPA